MRIVLFIFLHFSLIASADPAIDALIDELGHDRYDVRRKASHALYRHGAEAVSRLRRAMTSTDPEIAWRARAILESLGAWSPKAAPVDDEPFTPKGRVVEPPIILRTGEVIPRRLNPKTGRIELVIRGRQYPVSSLPELYRRYRSVYMNLSMRGPRRNRGVIELDWPAIGVSLQAARPLGLEVTRVIPSSPAATLGLKKGDRVVRIGGRLILEVDDFSATLEHIVVGQTYRVAVVRAGVEKMLVGIRRR